MSSGAGGDDGELSVSGAALGTSAAAHVPERMESARLRQAVGTDFAAASVDGG